MGKKIPQRECFLFLLKILNDSIEKLIDMLQKSNLEDIAMFLGKVKRECFFSNFFAGIARGTRF